ncbi:MAG TPA: MjaI family restriction endonuclease [Chitinophagales bacterium]|nr:MjaI family restriction endonuclease [Chitinophagales bacterium]
MAYTGGELNGLNGKYGISAPYKSVPVMKLIKEHRPKSKEELYELIKQHYENTCSCGVKSQGTVEDFGKNLYEAQIKEWGRYKYSLQECIQWEYDLFVIQSLKGTLVENKALSKLKSELSNYTVEEAEGFVDEELRIDLIVSQNGIERCGVQVKPLTFNLMREGVITFNKVANAKWGKPVYYLFYDDNENFTNIDEVFEQIKN